MHLGVVERRARLARQSEDIPAAIVYARRLVGLDSGREESVCLLMELLAESGERGLALIEYARLCRTLRDDLGLVPDIRTRALADWIKRGQNLNGKGIVPPTLARQQRAAPFSLDRPDYPGVSVQLLRNLTDNKRHDMLAFALSEDVAGMLAPDRMLDVSMREGSTARNTANVQDKSLYVVSGSIRAAESNLRIAIQLADSTGRCLWSSRFDYEPEQKLAAQDGVCAQIAARISYAIRTTEVERNRHRPIETLGIAQLYLRAASINRNGRAGNAQALNMLGRALDEDPSIALAHALAARCYHVQRMMGWRSPTDLLLVEGVAHAKKAVELSRGDGEVLWMAGLAIMNIEGDFTHAQSLIDESLSIDPSSTNAWIAGSFLNSHLGNGEGANARVRRAEMLNPFDRSHHVMASAAATAHFIVGDYAAANC